MYTLLYKFVQSSQSKSGLQWGALDLYVRPNLILSISHFNASVQGHSSSCRGGGTEQRHRWGTYRLVVGDNREKKATLEILLAQNEGQKLYNQVIKYIDRTKRAFYL